MSNRPGRTAHFIAASYSARHAIGLQRPFDGKLAQMSRLAMFRCLGPDRPGDEWSAKGSLCR